MSTNATNAQVAALLRTLNVAPTAGNIIQFQTVLGNNTSNCPESIGVSYTIEESENNPGYVKLGGSFTIEGDYSMEVYIEDPKGNGQQIDSTYTDNFLIEFTAAQYSKEEFYIVMIRIAKAKDEEGCGSYCSVENQVLPVTRQDIFAVTADCRE